MPLGNLIESLFPYKLDLYQQIDHQDDLTGALVKEWQFIETLPCSAKSIIANSARPRSGGDVQSLSNNKYAYEEYIEIRTQKKLNLRYKLSNIRTSKEEVLYAELNYPTETPTVFEIIGVSPISDPFNGVMMYNTLAKRSENQNLE